MLGHMDVVGVGDVALVRDAGDDAEAILQALGELIGGGFQGRTVEGVIDVLRCLPLGAFVVHLLHNLQGERLGVGVGVGVAGHVADTLIKARIAQGNGGVAAVEQLVDGFALLQTGQGTVLPEDGGCIRKGALQPVMAAPEGPVAQLQPLFKDAPELVHVPSGGQGHVRQIDGDHTLIEPAIIFGLPRLIILGIGDIIPAISGPVRGQEGPAAHAGVHVAVTGGLALGELVLPHFLLADVVRHHPLGSALGRQPSQIPVGSPLGNIVLLQHVNELGEGRGDPHAAFVLHALVALAEHFLNDEGQVLLLLVVPGLVQIHEHGDERSLAVGGHQGDHLILDGLYAPADLVPKPLLHHTGNLLLTGSNAKDLHFLVHGPADLLPAHLHEGSQVGQADGLAAVLVGGHLRDDLGGNVTGGGEGMGLLDKGAGNNRAVLEHILQIDEVAVVHMLGIVIGVVEVDDARLVGGHNLLGQQDALGDVLGHLTGHVVPLNGVDRGVLVGVLLLHFLVVALDEAQDAAVGRIGLAQETAGIAVSNILLGHFKSAVGHDGLLHQVLNFFHRRAAAHFLAGNLHALGDAADLQRRHADAFFDGVVGLGDGHPDLINVKNDFCTVSLNNFHRCSPFWRTLAGPLDPLRRAWTIILDIVVLSRVNRYILYEF